MGDKEGKKKGGCLRVFLIVLLVVVVVGVIAGVFLYRKVKEEMDKSNESMHSSTYVGQDCPDFEVTTTEGQTLRMSQLLDGKEVLCVVLFATWCGPCEQEFPEMDKVYQKYQDKFGMIALDVDGLDDEKAVKEYADSHGFSFPVAMGNDSLGNVEASAYPTTLIVDRNGKIGMHRIGSVPDAETFEKIVTTFMGDDYQERQLAYYTFYAYAGKNAVAGVEFTVTSEQGSETYVTDENGIANVFHDRPEDLKVQVTKVPDGYSIDGDGTLSTGVGSTGIQLPVK